MVSNMDSITKMIVYIREFFSIICPKKFQSVYIENLSMWGDKNNNTVIIYPSHPAQSATGGPMALIQLKKQWTDRWWGGGGRGGKSLKEPLPNSQESSQDLCTVWGYLCSMYI